MPLNEAAEVLTKGFADMKLTWDKDALEQNIAVTGGYPHSIQVVGHHLVDLDSNGNIEEDDWDSAIQKTATELQEKDFSKMYSFMGKQTGREKLLNVLALFGLRMSKSELAKDCKESYELTNAYQYLPTLEKQGNIRTLEDGLIELHKAQPNIASGEACQLFLRFRRQGNAGRKQKFERGFSDVVGFPGGEIKAGQDAPRGFSLVYFPGPQFKGG